MEKTGESLGKKRKGDDINTHTHTHTPHTHTGHLYIKFNCRRYFLIRLKYDYSVISVKIKRLQGNTKNRLFVR